jgi:type II secretory pathway pseudopilin PulG
MRKHHFTLVELLIVIAIIVILAGMLVTAVTRAMGKAEQAKCRATISALFNAIKQYESTYGVMPWQKSWDTTIFKAYKNTDITSAASVTSKPGKNDDCVIKVDDYTAFIKMLQGKGSSENLKKFNPRKIKFLEVQGSTEGEYKDPWGKDFTIVFNNTNHEDFFRKGIAPGVWSSSDSAIYASVIIWSKGLDEDERLGDSDDAIHDASNADNIYSFPVEYNKGEQRFEVTY